MTEDRSAAGRLDALCDDAEDAARDTPLAVQVAAIRDRLEEPLRVAIAGEVKVGKSTLLNALVSERLAQTDAGECTRIVTWYREGLGYEVRAVRRDGTDVALHHTREDGALQIDLGDLGPDEIERLDVAWPSSALRRVTLIDTPGLSSLDDSGSARTRDFLATEEHPSDADAVIYLLRHLHRRDLEFLDAFLDRSVSSVSPVNAVAVLARADEVGAGRLDALESAARIAARYRADSRLRSLCTAVVPVAGLVAETGRTLREHEAADLRTLAGLPDDELDDLLLSADHFASDRESPVGTEARRYLLRRFGMFGARYAVGAIRAGEAATAADLARLFVDASGVRELEQLLEDHFLPRARALKARAAIVALRAVVRALEEHAPDAAREIGTAIEEIEASSHEFAELRLAHVVLSGTVAFTEEEVAELRRLTTAGTSAERAGLDPGESGDEVQRTALAAVERWRARGASPLADPELCDACEVMARSYEGLHTAAAP